MLEDKLLILKLKRGDRDALRELYEKYKDNLRTIAGSLLGDSHAAEDVLHDVFVVFAENVRNLVIRTSLKNYLATCVVNRARDEYRRRQRPMPEPDNAGSSCSDVNSAESMVLADERSQIVTKALGGIPLEQREVIMLHLKGELKFREISRIQQTSLSTVHGRYRYGLKKLSVLLDGKLER